MSVTCSYSGRFGNCVFSAAMLIAYAKKHDLPYYLPSEARAYNHFRAGDIRAPFILPSTGEKPTNPTIYDEPGNKKTENPYYHEIPKMDNVMFRGYYQSPKYFSWCRDHILNTFNFPYQLESDVTGVHVRRGDCLRAPEAFPLAPREYYQNAIKYVQRRGYNKFRIYSDDIPWCKEEFINEYYPEAIFEFSEGKSEMEDYISLHNCQNQITARSTFSLTAAWMNRYESKIVCVPTTRINWWRSVNRDLLTDTNFTQIEFQNPT